ncbi:MAG: hypothetical protein AAB900_03225 [Patescibacteria group bacterium]
MKLSPGDKFFLIAISIIFDAINILFAVTIIFNTVINIFLGLFFIAWFKRKGQSEGGEDESDEEIRAVKEQTGRLKKQYQQLKGELEKRKIAKQEMAKGSGVGQEISSKQGEKLATEGESLATKEAEKVGVKTAERETVQTGERLATQIGEKVALKETEQITEKVAAKATGGLVSRILGRTFVAKIIPVLNWLPLWTFSTMLLLRGNKREQAEQEEAKESELASAKAEQNQYRQALRQMAIT